MKRTFKKVIIDSEIFLYPVPVIKEQKYLIQCGSDLAADEFVTAVEKGEFSHPDENSHDFVTVRHHTDGKTPILILKIHE